MIDTATLPPIERPPGDLTAWTAAMLARPVPVLASTLATLDVLRANEDAVDAHLLARHVALDPLMTLRLLTHVAALPRRGECTDVETVTAALVLLGIGPFFRAFGAMPTIEQVLGDHPQTLRGWHAVLRRAHRAANFALGFAVHRMDHDAPVIHEAALLHDFAEMLLWCHAPSLAGEVARRLACTPGLRSADAQRAVLGIELVDLQQSLMRAWRLPSLLIRLEDDRHAQDPAVRNVLLAIRVARHSAVRWNDPALPDDVRDVADLLHLGHGPALKLLQALDS